MLAVGVHSSAIACGMISTKGYRYKGYVIPFLECDFVVLLSNLVVKEREEEEVEGWSDRYKFRLGCVDPHSNGFLLFYSLDDRRFTATLDAQIRGR